SATACSSVSTGIVSCCSGCCAAVTGAGGGCCAPAAPPTTRPASAVPAASTRRSCTTPGFLLMLLRLPLLLAGLLLLLALRSALRAPAVRLRLLLGRQSIADLGARRVHDLLHARPVLRPERIHLLLARMQDRIDARLLLRGHAQALVVGAAAVPVMIVAFDLVRLRRSATPAQLRNRVPAQRTD